MAIIDANRPIEQAPPPPDSRNCSLTAIISFTHSNPDSQFHPTSARPSHVAQRTKTPQQHSLTLILLLLPTHNPSHNVSRSQKAAIHPHTPPRQHRTHLQAETSPPQLGPSPRLAQRQRIHPYRLPSPFQFILDQFLELLPSTQRDG